jgi:serine/threonine-protein kinase
VLPGGKGVVFLTRGQDGDRIQAVDVETGEVKDLTPGTYPRYSPTGHLLFIDADAVLLAAPFDAERLELTGAALPVAEGLTVSNNDGSGFFAVSQTGTLVYRAGAAGASATPVWVERDGTAREIDPGWSLIGVPANSSLALSPNEDRLAISILDSNGTFDLWVKQLPTGPLSLLTFEGTINRRVTWSPDGQSLTFISNRAGEDDLWTKRADGSGSADVVLDRERRTPEAFYSPDSTWIVFREGGGGSAVGDIFAIRPGVDSIAVPLAATDFGARSPTLSPDGRWLAYVSNEAGREEIYVRPFPDADSGRWLVSPDGGVEPVWAHSGRELFYRNGANELVAVQVSAGSSFAWDSQAVLFSMDDYLPSDGAPMYDVSPDDQRFVMLRIGGDETTDAELIMVTNFFEELRQRMGN